MLEAICFQTREVLEAMILDTAGMQHSASCPDLDPAALEASNIGGSSFGRPRLGLATNPLSRLAIETSAMSSSMPPSTADLTPSLQQQQQQQGGSMRLKSRDPSDGGGGNDRGRVSISSWGSSQQLLQGSLGYSLNLLRVDGGATNNNLLMQLQVGVVGYEQSATPTVGYQGIAQHVW
jgi:glycerol kinase